ncbi:MAG TPA: hypothetical protein VLX44_10275 [Xanthobacteraceae bacterium]|nr:hypothetical protein [Xanthobacteraceae bacterium]
MSKHFIAFGCVLSLLLLPCGADAASYTCPAPNQINCVPATKVIGPWHDNNSQATGNAFGPNNQCANVIPLPGGKIRLLCCYTKCGVFLRDVVAKRCTKPSESEFTCD